MGHQRKNVASGLCAAFVRVWLSSLSSQNEERLRVRLCALNTLALAHKATVADTHDGEALDKNLCSKRLRGR